MAVTRCVCFKRRFAELLPLVRARGLTTVAQIGDAFGCGTGCGGCRPYLAAMLRSDATCFRVQQGPGEPQPCPPDPWDR